MMQEQCCHSQLEELHCAAGIHLAGEPDGCASPAAAPHRGNASLEALFVKVSVRPPPAGPGPSQLSSHCPSAGGRGGSPPCTPAPGRLSFERQGVPGPGGRRGRRSLLVSSSRISEPRTTPWAQSGTREARGGDQPRPRRLQA